MIKSRLKKLLPAALIIASGACTNQPEQKPNVLFLFVDDLRPSLGSYGFPDVKSPNIDQLAEEGIQFNRAYCNVPVCGASRASLMTGLRPHWPDRFRNYLSRADEECPNTITLPEHFVNNGYIAISNGKVFHHQDDTEEAWSEPPWKPDTTTVINFSNVNYLDSASIAYINPKSGAGPYFEAAEAPDSLYFDGKVTRKAISDLRRLSKQDKPFFLAVGFHKPHLPFNAPKKYYDLYDSVEIADNRFLPEGLPAQSRNSREIFVYGRLDHYNSLDFHYEARHAYLACVSFVDEKIGQIMNTLKELNLDENTVVVLIGDHGWHLGEHNYWGKHNTLHNALHTPLIIKAPGYKHGEIEQVVEFVDIYPTLCDLTGIPKPDHLKGESMTSIMQGDAEYWKNIAFTEWQGARNVVTDRYSYSYWFEERHKGAKMLFDLETDPRENKNVAFDPEYSEVVKELQTKLDTLYSNFEL
jgi:arylsulfatase A-like enzyme